MGCSGDVIVAGNIRIVEEIRHRHESHNHETNAPIVINSILPKGSKNLVVNNPAWKTIQEVNQRLACYAAVTEDVYFANATDLFSETRDDGGIYAKKDYFEYDYLHPNAEGNRAWEEFIVKKVLTFLK